jgi:hypothetical protein
MDLEETEVRNDCVGEGQQQYNRPTYSWERAGEELVERTKELVSETVGLDCI